MSKMSRLKKNPPPSKAHYEIHVRDIDGDWCIGVIEKEGMEDEFLMYERYDEALSIYKKLLENEAKKGPDEEKFELRIATARVWGFASGYVPSELELLIEP